MKAPWMDHPRLVAWFDDLEDAVTAALALKPEQRSEVKALKAPRATTWVMLASTSESCERLRTQLRDVQQRVSVPVAADCDILAPQGEFDVEEDTFDCDNGFRTVDLEYIEEGSAEDLRRELLSDAEDYAASVETGWFYAAMERAPGVDEGEQPQ